MTEPATFNLPKFFIFGDSHAGTLMRAARTLGLDFAGGSIMAGMYLNDPFFDVCDGCFVMKTDLGAERLNFRLTEAGLGENFLDVDMPILSTVGFNATNFSGPFISSDFAIEDGPVKRLLSMACFRAVVEASRQGAIEFYRALTQEKKNVFAVLSPQRFTRDNFATCKAFNKTMVDLVSAMGVKIIDVSAETTGPDGILLPEFGSSQDHAHGNDAFGTVVFRRFSEMLASS